MKITTQVIGEADFDHANFTLISLEKKEILFGFRSINGKPEEIIVILDSPGSPGKRHGIYINKDEMEYIKNTAEHFFGGTRPSPQNIKEIDRDGTTKN